VSTSWLERSRAVVLSVVLLVSLAGTATLVAGVGSSSFVADDFREQRGDVASITVDTGSTSTVTVVIGSDRVGYRAEVTVTDGSDFDDEVTIRLNTLRGGAGADAISVAGSDSLDSVRITNGAPGALADIQYGLLVYDGREVTDDWSDSAVLDLTSAPEPAVSALVVPTGENPNSADDVADAAIEPGNAVALGESLALRLDGLPAIEGYFATRSGTADERLLDVLLGDSGPYRLQIVESDPELNTDRVQLDERLTQENTELYRTGDRVFLLVDTEALPRSRLTATYDASLTVGPFDADPGLVDTTKETSFEIASPQVSITRKNGFAVERAPLAGTTTLSPGTTLTVRVRTPAGVLPRKDTERTVTVGPDQEWSARFDFSPYDEGDEYQLIVTDGALVNRSVTGTVRVDDPPQPQFTVSASNPSPDDQITLDAGPSSDDGVIEQYEWDLDGDGDYNDASGETVTTSYPTAGDYSVGLQVVDDGNNRNQTRQTVSVENTPPRATFDANVEREGEFAINVNASASSDPDGTIEQYRWVVERDGRGDGVRRTLEIAERGRYEVRLVVVDNGNAENQTTRTIKVSKRPNPEITVRDTVGAGREVELSGENSTSPGGTVQAYRWELPNGETATGETITTRFPTTGTATVELTAVDDVGTRETVTRNVTVVEPPDVEMTVSPRNPADDETLDLQAVSDADLERVEWDLNGDGEFERSFDLDNENLTTSWFADNPGEQTLRVRVTDTRGVRNVASETVSVRDVDPNVSFGWTPSRPNSGLGVSFEGSSTNQIQSWKWDFDQDGEFEATGQTVVNAFNETGSQAVTLQVADQFGDTAQLSREVTVQESASFDLRVTNDNVSANGFAIATLTANNRLPDKQISVKLQLDLPDSVNIAGVGGGASKASSSSTNFFNISAGGSKSLRVRLQFTGGGQYELSGRTVYYVGEAGNATRRVGVTRPVDIAVGGETPTATPTATSTATPTDDGSGGSSETSGQNPGPVLVALAVLLLVVLFLWRRSSTGASGDSGDSDDDE